MIIDEQNKILLGNSIPLPEDDVDDDRSDYQDGEDALFGYWEATILDNIGTGEFRQNYNSVIQNFKEEAPTGDQISFCYAIIDKIKEVYDYEFPNELEIWSNEDIKDVLKFLEFIEFDNESFILNVWKMLDFNIKNGQIEDICLQYSKKIISGIEYELESSYYPELVSTFLRTYIKDDIIKWFANASKQFETEIRIMKQEGEEI